MNYNDLLDTLKAARFAKKAGSIQERIPFLQNALDSAKKEGFNELSLQFARILQDYYLVVAQDLDQGEFYQEEADAAQYLLNIETEVHLKYAHFAYYINRSRSLPEDIESELNMFVREYAPYTGLNNFGINLNLYPIIIAHYYKQGENKKAIEVCQKAIEYFKSIKSNKVYLFYFMMVPSLIIAKRYKEANDAILEAQTRLIGKSYNLSTFKFYEVVNLLHWKKYEKALEKTQEATKKKQSNPALAEQWQIVKGFLQVLSNADKITKTNFRVSKLLKDMPIFSKDRAGNYAHILILKTISAIQNDRDLMHREAAKVDKAVRKHFKEGSRNEHFMNMLLQVPEQDFQYEQIIDFAETDFQKLRNMEMNTDHLEIVPFEDLWSICINFIKEHELVYVK